MPMTSSPNSNAATSSGGSALYLPAGAWLLVQVATQDLPLFHVAEWVMRLIVVAAIIGFPFALGSLVVLRVNPKGLRLDFEIPPNESITRQTGKRRDRWIIAILALAVILLLADKLVLHKERKLEF